jgi:hypothetical protein
MRVPSPIPLASSAFELAIETIYDDYMLSKVTLGVLKGASKLNVLLLL